MRFIINFIFFGILFYIIYLFFPDAFQTLVGWANQTYEFIKDIVLQITDKARSKEAITTAKEFISLLNIAYSV